MALTTVPARAAPDTVTQARNLAEEAGDLLDAKRYAEALDRVTRAEALYHAPTHELMMGQAQEGLGHLATALGIYEKLAVEPLPVGSPRAFLDAQQTGKGRLRALLARVPSLLVVLHGLGPDEHADVRVDGEPFAMDVGKAQPLDAGSHAIAVSVQGRELVRRDVVLPEKGGVVTVELSVEPKTTDKAEARPAQVPSAPLVPPAPPARETQAGSLVPALSAFGVGVVGLGVGAVSGAFSLANVSDLRSRCPDNHCLPAQQAEIDSTKTLGTVSTVGFIAGGVGAAAGVVLLLLRRPSGSEMGGAHRTLAPWAGIGAAGVEGTF